MRNYTVNTGVSLSADNLRRLQTIANATGLSRNRVVNLLIANSNIYQQVSASIKNEKSSVSTYQGVDTAFSESL